MPQEILLEDGVRVNRHEYMEQQKAAKKAKPAEPDLKEAPANLPAPTEENTILPPALDYVKPDKALSKFNKSELVAYADHLGLEVEGNKEDFYNAIHSHLEGGEDSSDDL